MSKKEKKVHELAEEIESVIVLVSKLENLIKAHKEITAGYQKYRKNGGEAIPGIEKHLCIKEETSVPAAKKKTIVAKPEVEVPQEEAGKKPKKKKTK